MGTPSDPRARQHAPRGTTSQAARTVHAPAAGRGPVLCRTAIVSHGTNAHSCVGTCGASDPLLSRPALGYCSDDTCPALQLPNGTVACTNGDMYDSTCTLTCDSGFKRSGAASRTCGAQGAWSGTLTRCSSITCQRLPQPPARTGTLSCTHGNVDGSTCSLACSTGYNVSGSAVRTCQASGNWSGSPGSCQGMGRLHGMNGGAAPLTWVDGARPPPFSEVTCPPLSLPNGTLECSAGRQYGSTCDADCATGFTRHGSANRTCLANGMWSGSTTQCTGAWWERAQLTPMACVPVLTPRPRRWFPCRRSDVPAHQPP